MRSDVEQYFEAVPGNRRERLNVLHELIIGLYPQASVDMSYRMPTDKHGQGWVALANQKSYISLYTCSYEHIRDFADKYPAIKTGKGCINFRDRDALPLTEIQQVVSHAMDQVKG